MNILIPGRHHLLTDFQFKYLYWLIQTGLKNEPDVYGTPIGIEEPIEKVVFAVTSANHSNTRRNPIPFHLRAMAILDFAQELETPTYIFGIDDVGHLEDFAGYVQKKIKHESEGLIDMTPENTVVACSTPVMEMYEKKGFRILPIELIDKETWTNSTLSAWELVEQVANNDGRIKNNQEIFRHIHQASYLIWSRYQLDEKVRKIFSDDMIGADGDLTETRDYNSYVRQMDEIADLKYKETAPFIRAGRIGDIGCAVGSWIQLACQDPKFRESDFYGIEVARQLYNICLQRKENGEFENPYVFFAQKNAVTGLCFDANSMDTIHGSSLTHEIESYGGREDLLKFIQNRFSELAPGGVWINRDVVGPENGDESVLLWLNTSDGRNEDWEAKIEDSEELATYLNGLSTFGRFLRFAQDFRAGEDYDFPYQILQRDGKDFVQLSLRNAMEFISKKDYTGNWRSEMHEMFCFWSFNDWQKELKAAGFHISSNSTAFTNNWLVENRYKGKAELFSEVEGKVVAREYPVTHMIMVAQKRV